MLLSQIIEKDIVPPFAKKKRHFSVVSTFRRRSSRSLGWKREGENTAEKKKKDNRLSVEIGKKGALMYLAQIGFDRGRSSFAWGKGGELGKKEGKKKTLRPV